jgi:hypothetical protein
MIVLIDWLIDWLNKLQPILVISFGYFQISQFEEVQQSFQVQKKPEQRTDFLLLQSPEAFWLVFFHVMTWENKQEKELQKRETWASCRLLHGGGAEEAHHPCKSKGSFVNTTSDSTSAKCPCSLSLSLSLHNSSCKQI